MNKFLIAALILSVALACHPSCNCTPGTHVCASCKNPNSSVDSV
jgi:hypothetical protein